MGTRRKTIKRTMALNLRVTKELHDAVKAAADHDGVTMSAWVSRLLTSTVRQPAPQAKQ